ncbi:MAG: rRNA pseudouridine synthase [Clostridiales bacterium]|nr:rRNA pseudouridine synthase [Clostridiales bacterium]HCH68460.1 pseudouridine synthase [Clostridiales bacterium]
MEERLQKYMADCGLMSRRAAEEEIRKGLVTVNGVPAELGTKVTPGVDQVLYKNRKVVMPRGEHVYIMLNKPAGYVTTANDEKGRPCVTDLVKAVGRRVYPIGRLDMASEGLLLLTDDGALTETLTHPRHSIPKIYNVKVEGEITEEQYKTLLSPMEIDGYPIRPVYTEVLKRKDGKTLLQMTLYEGRNRQIRKMCEQVGLQIRFLKRIAIGNLTLGRLRVGEWRYLTKEQVSYLKGEENHV